MSRPRQILTVAKKTASNPTSAERSRTDNSSFSGALPVRRANISPGSLESLLFRPHEVSGKKAGTKDWSRQVLAGCPDKTFNGRLMDAELNSIGIRTQKLD